MKSYRAPRRGRLSTSFICQFGFTFFKILSLIIMPLKYSCSRRLACLCVFFLPYHLRPASGKPVQLSSAHDSLRQTSPAVIFQPKLRKLSGNPHYFIPHQELAHPRIGLALSGGGARCLAQIGVLQAVEESGFQIDFIAGTSMGSFVGGMYAAGYSAKQLRDLVKKIAWADIMKDTPPRKNLLFSQKQERDLALLRVRFNGFKPHIPHALTAGQKLHSVLAELTWKGNYWASGSFDDLRVPFRAIATDVYSGEEVVLENGDLSEAIRASGALPLLIAPVPKGDMLLVDGGVANNIPVDVVRRYGIEIVIAVDATSNLRSKEHISSPWEFADQVTTIMQQEKNARQRGAADILISFEDLARTSLDFANLDSLIQLGYERMLEKLPELRARYQETNEHTRDETREEYSAAVVRVQGETLISHFEQARNGNTHKLSGQEIQQRVENLYASGDYDRVEARLKEDTLTFTLARNPILRAARFHGNTIYADSVLQQRLRSKRGAHINHHQGKEDLTAVIEHYRRDGYALAQISNVNFDSASGVLDITIDEGRVTRIEIEGLQRSQDFVVTREFSLRAGEIFNSKRARQGIDNIHSTGLFENVSLMPQRLPQGGVLLKIKIEEKPYNVVRLGDYYQSERGNLAFLELGNENVLGTGSKLFVHGALGTRDQETKLAWRSDRIFRTFLTLSASAYRRVQENFIYDEQFLHETLGKFSERRAGMRVSVGQQVRRFGALSAELRWEEVHFGSRFGAGYPAGTSRITALILRSALDTRDRLPFTRGGRYLNVSYEYAKPSLPEEDSFIKFFAHAESFHSLGPHTLHTKFLGGAADRTTPFSEQFRLGGPQQIFGLRDQQFIGRQMVLGSLAYRYQLRKRPFFDTYLSVRYDVSGIWRDQFDASYKKIRHALGVAITLDTPLGPMGVALGTYENRQKRVYFTFGVPF